jgi:hypothetical protein
MNRDVVHLLPAGRGEGFAEWHRVRAELRSRFG